ncbi:putative L-PSP endoribonuclease family protein [Mycena galericulata]|nr:putative L-PSP endoribonuclease family protein [Mycena galericulata]
MPSPTVTYHNYHGVGAVAYDMFGYSQAVRIGDRIECAGQGGWDASAPGPRFQIPQDIDAQIDLAFANCELALKAAGGKGWSEVYKVRSHHVGLDDVAQAAMTRNLKKWAPHGPIWTLLGVPRLGLDEMKVEIEVYAVVGQAQEE